MSTSQNSEQRVDNKLERLTHIIEQGFAKINHQFDVLDQTVETRFNLLKNDINWLKWVIAVFGIPTLLLLIQLKFDVIEKVSASFEAKPPGVELKK